MLIRIQTIHTLDYSKRYFIVSPKVDGTLYIKSKFSAGHNNNRIYYKDLGENEELVLADYSKSGNTGLFAIGNTTDEKENSLPLEAKHKYLFWVYQNACTITGLSFDYDIVLPQTVDAKWEQNFTGDGYDSSTIERLTDTEKDALMATAYTAEFELNPAKSYTSPEVSWKIAHSELSQEVGMQTNKTTYDTISKENSGSVLYGLIISGKLLESNEATVTATFNATEGE